MSEIEKICSICHGLGFIEEIVDSFKPWEKPKAWEKVEGNIFDEKPLFEKRNAPCVWCKAYDTHIEAGYVVFK